MPPLALREKDLATLEGIFRRYPSVREVRLFGSRASGRARRLSDIDLVFVSPGMSDAEWARLRLDLDEAPIVYDIDAVRLDRLEDGPLKERIRRDARLVYSIEPVAIA